ncbi:MAG TPA: hypothetical protein VMT85_24415 [Thermoanaerobaculia bacterium]|nr:hypothetical protein [Thermoanaerobaculia bacterium]
MRETPQPATPLSGRHPRRSPTVGLRRVQRLLFAAGAGITLAATAAGGAATGATPATPATVTSPVPVPDVTWRRLVFRASKLLVTATAEVELSWQEAPAVVGELESFASGEPLPPSGDSVAHLTVSSQLLGRESRTDIWLDPVDLAALQRRQLEEGKRERFKLYRFGRHEIFSRRVRPREEERGNAFETWTDVQEEILPRDTKSPVSDPSALFYWLSAIEPTSLSDGETLVVFSKSMLNPVVVRYAGAEAIRVDYELYGAPDPEGNAIQISGRIPAYRYTLTPGAGDDDELELLGLEGELELWVDAVRRVPLRLTGRVSPVGRVSANLTQAWLAPGED